jgi:hypothetical protein
MSKWLNSIIWPGGGPDHKPGTNTVVSPAGNAFKKAHEASKKHKGRPQTVQNSDGSTVSITTNPDGSTRVKFSDGRDTTFPKGANPT